MIIVNLSFESLFLALKIRDFHFILLPYLSLFCSNMNNFCSLLRIVRACL